jgi:formate dehydrogenase subunit gamma
MTRLLARLGTFLGAAIFLFVLMAVSPVRAQQPASVNPNAAAVQEQQLLQELKRVQGRITIPDAQESVLIQPAGRDWRHFHQVTLHWIGAIAMIGMLVLLAVFYLVRGTIKIASGRSGRTILRFDALERTVHWMTAVSFIVLGISGLNITFGRSLLLPLMDPQTFTNFSEALKYAHNYLSFPFTIGILFMLFMWIKDNIPDRTDVEWLKEGGGMVGDKHPPARRFNAGQKGIFWIVVLGGVAMAISGYLLMFPFYAGTGIADMQWAQVVHGVVGVLFIAAIFAHIYIGTLGMEGAFEAMGEGEVDVNWAKEHHSLWVKEEMGKSPSSAHTRMTPAE